MDHIYKLHLKLLNFNSDIQQFLFLYQDCISKINYRLNIVFKRTSPITSLK